MPSNDCSQYPVGFLEEMFAQYMFAQTVQNIANSKVLISVLPWKFCILFVKVCFLQEWNLRQQTNEVYMLFEIPFLFEIPYHVGTMTQNHSEVVKKIVSQFLIFYPIFVTCELLRSFVDYKFGTVQ